MIDLSKVSKSSLNSRRYFWIILGFYLVAIYIRTTSAQPQNLTSTVTSIKQNTDTPGPSSHSNGIQIFTVDWNNISDIAIITLWIVSAVLAKIAFHITPKLGRIFPESCLLIVVGIVIGVVIFYTTKAQLGNALPTRTFLFFMLPPIILDAGYFMPSRLFFGNLGTILLMAVIGTLWNAFTIGFTLWGLHCVEFFGPVVEVGLLELLLFSTLISAVDPVAVIAVFEEIHVNDILYVVVFGESLLNDAVTIVLYHMFEDYAVMGPDKITTDEILKGVASFPVVALGGTLIGVLWGLLTGFSTKFTYRVLAIEPLFVFLMAYLSYLNAELFHMSGVLAITFCGIIMKKYVESNICSNSSITVKYALKTLSSSSETIIFIFLGVSTVSNEHVWNTWFVVSTITLCTIYRFLGVLWMSAFANKFRLNKLNMVDQFVMSYGGLRGAVSFALALLIPINAVQNKDTRCMFVTTTITVVFFTVFIQGITIKPFVEWLEVERSEKRDLNMNERLQDRLVDHALNAMETITGSLGQNKLRDLIKRIDQTYVMPYLIRDYKGSAHTKILETYSKLEIRDAAVAVQNGRRRSRIFGSKVVDKKSVIRKKSAVEVTIDTAPSSRRASVVNYDGPDWMENDVFIPSKRVRRSSYSRHSLGISDLAVEPISLSPKTAPRRKLGVPSMGTMQPGGHFNTAFDLDDFPEDVPRGSVPMRKLNIRQISRQPDDETPNIPPTGQRDPKPAFPSSSVTTPVTIHEEGDPDVDVFSFKPYPNA